MAVTLPVFLPNWMSHSMLSSYMARWMWFFATDRRPTRQFTV